MTIIEQLIPLADAHQAADEYRAGRYEFVDRGKGLGACAIGCMIRDAIALGVLPKGTNPDNHRALAAAIGIPEWSLHLVDDLFERLPRENRPAFTPAFLRRARNVADWKRVQARFLIAILDRCSLRDASGSCVTVAALWRRVLDGESIESLQPEFESARESAMAAARESDAQETLETLAQRDDLFAAMESEASVV